MPHWLWLIGHTINSILGTGSQDSWAYKFWSAPASNILVLVAMWKWYKHNKCHECYRLGHHIPHLHYPVCSRHKPKETVQADTTVIA